MRDVRDINVIGIRGQHDGDIGVISIWPIFNCQDWVNVLWSDGTITTVTDGDIMVPNESEQIERQQKVKNRIIELYRMTKPALITLTVRSAREKGISWAMGGPKYWSKDELVNRILDLEFANETG